MCDLVNPVVERIRLFHPSSYSRMPRDFAMNSLLLDVCFSRIEGWDFSSDRNTYYLNSDNGTVIGVDTHTPAEIERLHLGLGADGLQILMAALGAYVDHQKYQYGTLPDYQDLQPIAPTLSDLLRVLGRESQGKHGGYSHVEQERVKESMLAWGGLAIFNIRGVPGSDHGPVLHILEDGHEAKVNQMEPDKTATLSSRIAYMPGPGIWSLLKRGVDAFPPELLKLHPRRHRYTVAAGFYLCALMIVRRKKREQRTVNVGHIERSIHAGGFDSNEHRRLKKLIQALHRLAGLGIIESTYDADGRVIAMFTGGKHITHPSALRRYRGQLVALWPEESSGEEVQPMSHRTHA